MRAKALIIILAFFIASLTACIIKSLHPFYSDNDIVFDESIIGTFMDQDSAIWTFSQTSYAEEIFGPQKKHSSYRVTFEDDHDSSVFIVHLFELNGLKYFDFLPVFAEGETLKDIHMIPVHSVARVKFWGKNNFSFIWYSQEWLDDLSKNKKLKIDHENVKTGLSKYSETTVLTAETKDLQKFIIKYGSNLDLLRNLEISKDICETEDIFCCINKIIDSDKFKNEQGKKLDDVIFVNMRRIDKIQ